MRLRSRAGGMRVLPDGGKVGGEVKDLLPMDLVQGHAIGLPLAVVVFMGVGAGAGRVVPVGFEGIGDQRLAGSTSR